MEPVNIIENGFNYWFDNNFVPDIEDEFCSLIPLGWAYEHYKRWFSFYYEKLDELASRGNDANETHVLEELDYDRFRTTLWFHFPITHLKVDDLERNLIIGGHLRPNWRDSFLIEEKSL